MEEKIIGVRLINAENLQFNNYTEKEREIILKFINEQPTAYDIDRVLYKINKSSFCCEGYEGIVIDEEDVIHIVNTGGDENDTQICCRPPKLPEYYDKK